MVSLFHLRLPMVALGVNLLENSFLKLLSISTKVLFCFPNSMKLTGVVQLLVIIGGKDFHVLYSTGNLVESWI